MGKTKTKNQKKSRHGAAQQAEDEFATVPHSFIFHRGQIGKNVGQLAVDMRRVMAPFTAESLKVRKKNVLKDFVTVAGPLGVTHFMIFTRTDTGVNLVRICRTSPISFRQTQYRYSLVKDVISSLKKHRMHEQQFKHHPLLVLNNFGVEGMHIKLMASMFQNMFPSIKVHKVNLNSIKRCVLLNYDPASQEVELRHYSLKVVPVGMSRGVKKLLQEKCPNMNKFEDISELLMKGANLSESEAEQDGDHNTTELPQAYSGRGNIESEQSAVRLTEIGPRMTLQLVKIVEGIGQGNVLYHSIISRTEEELQEMLKRKEAQLKAKAERKKQQEENVAQKKTMREENRKKSLEGIKRKRQQETGGTDDSEVEDPGMQEDQAAAAEESEDEAEYYRQAVGEEPFKKQKLSTGRDSSAKGSFKDGKQRKPSPKPPGKSDTRGQKKGEGLKRFPGKRAMGEGVKRFGGKVSKARPFGGQKMGRRTGEGGKKYAGGKMKGGLNFKGQKTKSQNFNERAKKGGKQGSKQKKGRT
uniref:Brix domain-containing protein n=1 Tax=Denticeps clupeoides TaxID=299321 RepID=A0AAY4B0E0_9TELE